MSKIISVDTEYNNKYIPFIATSTDEQLRSRLYYMNIPKDVHDLKVICESKNIIKCWHASANDIFALSNININAVPPYEDTMCAAPLLNENYQSKALKNLAKVYLHEKCLEEALLKKVKAKYKRECKKKGIMFDYSMIPKEVIEPYAIKDTEYTMKLWYLFKGPLQAYKEAYQLEIDLIPRIVEMMKRGFLIDRKFVRKQIKDCEKQIEHFNHVMNKLIKKNHLEFYDDIIRVKKQSIYNYVEKHNIKKFHIFFHIFKCNKKFTVRLYKDFNPASKKDLQKVINKLDILITKETKTGLSTEGEVLKLYIDGCIDKKLDGYKFINALLQFRFYEKQRNTYYLPLLKKYTSKNDPIAHFMFYQSGAKSGRFTAELIQTIPRIS